MDFFASCAPGTESLLAEELRALGVPRVRETRAGASFQGHLIDGYRAVHCSRIASRVMLTLARGEVRRATDAYDLAASIPWPEHLRPDMGFVVERHGRFPGIRDTRMVTLRVKDAVVDRIRQDQGQRPSISKDDPDLRVIVNSVARDLVIGLDIGSGPLHERGYRARGVTAPLKENLAAAILMRLGWERMADEGAPLVDPMCGSGTFLIEAAMIAGRVAPGYLKTELPNPRWPLADAAAWADVLDQAAAKRRSFAGTLRGYDRDARSVKAAQANIEVAGFNEIQVDRRAIEDWPETMVSPAGLVVCNPPYGGRLGSEASLVWLYAQLGELLRRDFVGWRAGVLTGSPELGKTFGIKARKATRLNNGPIECLLLDLALQPDRFLRKSGETLNVALGFPVLLESGAVMFANRLKKNIKHLKSVLEDETGCFRVYDADMPEYNVAIDRYENHLVIAEYAAPADLNPVAAERRFRDVLLVAPELLGVEKHRVAVKLRKPQRGAEQYQRNTRSDRVIRIKENGLIFEVNLWDYLDTGLFLDHRLVRAHLRASVRDLRFLNLFAYTGSATVYAASGQARETTSIDLSQTYLDWARRNLSLNGFGGNRHRLIRDDVLAWLDRERNRYDLVLVDPPSFSNSKKMRASFDVQRDHVALLRLVLGVLSPAGTIVFSTNRKKFKLETEAIRELGLDPTDLTKATMPPDFVGRAPIHQCWQLRRHG